MSNPDGNTGKRSVKYVSPNHTQVTYNDRVLDIRTTGETPEEFASKVKAATGKVPRGYKTKAQAYKERRAAQAKKRAAEEKARKAAAKKGAGSKGTGRKSSTSKKPSAPMELPSIAPVVAAPKTNLEKGLASGKYVFE